MVVTRGLMQAAAAGTFRQRAEQRIRSLEAALEEQAKDRAAAVVVIEQLQKELREARCECVVLTDQRRYFEERAAAAGARGGELSLDGAAPGFRGDPDAGPGLVPVQELIEARAQAADARADAFSARQEVQTAHEHAAELLRQLRERVCCWHGTGLAQGGHACLHSSRLRVRLYSFSRQSGGHLHSAGCAPCRFGV